MEDIQGSGVTWISPKEMQSKKLCKYCHEPMDVKQLNLTEACRMCFNNKCCISFMEIPEVEYIRLSYKNMGCDLGSISDYTTKLVSPEEEMQSINKLFSEIEGMLSSKVMEQYKSDLLVPDSRNLVTKKPIVSPTLQVSSDLKQVSESVSLNPVSEVCNPLDSNMFSLEQHLNITDLTNDVFNDLSTHGFPDIGSFGSINSQSAVIVQDTSTLSCTSGNLCFGAQGNNADGIRLLVDTSTHNYCSETPPSNPEHNNEELPSISYLEDILATDGINQENVDRSTEADSSGSSTKWLDTMVNCSEDISIVNASFFLERFKDDVDIAHSQDEKLLQHTITEYQEEEVDYCKAENSVVNIKEETTKRAAEATTFPKEERKTFRCYRPSKRHQRQTSNNSKVAMSVNFASFDIPSNGATLSHSSEKYCQFSSASEGSQPLTSVMMPCKPDTDNVCKVENRESDGYELFGDVTLDVDEFPCPQLSDSVCAMPPLLQQEESSKQVKFLLSSDRLDETHIGLKEEVTPKEEEIYEVFVDSCSIPKRPDTDEEVIFIEERFGATNEACTIVEEPGMLAVQVSNKCVKVCTEKSFKYQREKILSAKKQCGNIIRSEMGGVFSDQAVNSAEKSKIDCGSPSGCSELSSFQGAKCSFTAKANTRRKSLKRKKKEVKAKREASSSVSDEIENAIASMQLLSKPEIKF